MCECIGERAEGREPGPALRNDTERVAPAAPHGAGGWAEGSPLGPAWPAESRRPHAEPPASLLGSGGPSSPLARGGEPVAVPAVAFVRWRRPSVCGPRPVAWLSVPSRPAARLLRAGRSWRGPEEEGGRYGKGPQSFRRSSPRTASPPPRGKLTRASNKG